MGATFATSHDMARRASNATEQSHGGELDTGQNGTQSEILFGDDRVPFTLALAVTFIIALVVGFFIGLASGLT